MSKVQIQELADAVMAGMQEYAKLAAEDLKALGFTLTESRANFLFARCPDGLGGKDYYAALKERGVLVRRWDREMIQDWVRITVGTPEEMAALIAATKDILGRD